MIKNSFKEKIKYMIIGGALLTTMYGNITFATSTLDLTPPKGKLEIKNILQLENMNYINLKEIEIEVNAKDDMCKDTEIKYYLSTSPISNAAEIDENLWKSYSPGKIEKVTLPSVDNALYVVFKDPTGNTSLIYNGTNVKYTFVYDKNAGDATMFSSTVGTTTYYGMPYIITMQEPTRVNYDFIGWSTTPNATTASYKSGDIIPASAFVGGGKTITLYAVWSQSTDRVAYLADVVEIGDYVNYPVSYDNIYSVLTNGGSYVNMSSYNGWRVISKDIDLNGNVSTGTVNLISAGVPLRFHHGSNPAASVEALTTNFLTTTYHGSGFLAYKTLTEAFSNKFTAIDSQKGTPLVRSVNLTDIRRATGDYSLGDRSNLSAAKYEGLYYNEACYWLAGSEIYHNTYLYGLKPSYIGYGNGYVSYSCTSGVRPIVSLKPKTIANGKDAIGAWNIIIND